jgi:hypothetical protein
MHTAALSIHCFLVNGNIRERVEFYPSSRVSVDAPGEFSVAFHMPWLQHSPALIVRPRPAAFTTSERKNNAGNQNTPTFLLLEEKSLRENEL